MTLCHELSGSSHQLPQHQKRLWRDADLLPIAPDALGRIIDTQSVFGIASGHYCRLALLVRSGPTVCSGRNEPSRPGGDVGRKSGDDGASEERLIATGCQIGRLHGTGILDRSARGSTDPAPLFHWVINTPNTVQYNRARDHQLSNRHLDVRSRLNPRLLPGDDYLYLHCHQSDSDGATLHQRTLRRRRHRLHQ